MRLLLLADIGLFVLALFLLTTTLAVPGVILGLIAVALIIMDSRYWI